VREILTEKNHQLLFSFRLITLYKSTVLGLTRIGLVFTGTQEGNQPSWLTQTGQTNGVSDTVFHHALCRVAELAGGRRVAAWESAEHQAVRELCCVFPCLFYIFLSLLLLFTVGFLYCSAKLPLSRPTSFVFFSSHSPSHPNGGKNDRAATWSFAAGSQTLMYHSR